MSKTGPAPSYTFSSPASATSPNVLPTTATPSYHSPPQTSLSSYAGPSHWRPPAHWGVDDSTNNISAPKKPPRKKIRTAEEEEITSATAARIASRLASDHALVRFPDVDTPFADKFDAIGRLLPYHVFLQPQEDLSTLPDRKGKTKALFDEQEIQETKFALECARRRRKLMDRFRKARARSGQQSSPNDQTIVLTQAILEADRTDLALLNSELRSARVELEKLEREKRTSNPPAHLLFPIQRSRLHIIGVTQHTLMPRLMVFLNNPPIQYLHQQPTTTRVLPFLYSFLLLLCQL
ncbi:hypothetical protein VKT23_000941 [Stygiomarasmius scandens]|uniref:GLTSCR protein conserved domain-containing protein n=1 Tax=Marasmiellus scandens TaxID=2682957 RepID=A0ABR1K868_9AGAR